jgi:HPt (histidine-containing phosphotransfer) domain-containing protein
VNSCLNLVVLNELIDIMGDDMEMLINAYIEDTESKLTELSEMNVETQQEDIFRMSHSIKGSSRNVGIANFADHCEVLESKAREGVLLQSEFIMSNIVELFNSAKTELLQKITINS